MIGALFTTGDHQTILNDKPAREENKANTIKITIE
jgi:hypothetical protein